MYRSLLEIPDFKVLVSLGCETWEREEPQSVNFKIKIGFSKEIKAEISDELSDTICYAEVSELVVNEASKGEYKLVEKLVRDVHDRLKDLLPEGAGLLVKAHKLKPPIDILKKGVFYSLGDLSL